MNVNDAPLEVYLNGTLQEDSILEVDPDFTMPMVLVITPFLGRGLKTLRIGQQFCRTKLPHADAGRVGIISARS